MPCVPAGSKLKHVMDMVFGAEAAVRANAGEELWFHPAVRWALAALLLR